MHAARGWWRPTGSLSRALVWLFAAQAVFQVALIAQGTPKIFDRYANVIQALVNGHDALARRRFENIRAGSDFALFQFAGFVATGALIVLIIWQWRSAMNAQALQRDGARLSPGWAIAGWLVPIVNFVVPAVVMQDLWRSSDPHAKPGSEWRRLHGSPLITTWWITYVVGTATPLVVMSVVIITSVSAHDTNSFMAVGHAVFAASSILTVLVVRQITVRQELQQATSPAPTAPVRVVSSGAISSATVTGGGWHPDPLGRFDYRYWDGTVWTDWVSTNGDMSVDPEPVPGY